jgi:hypothetical protein
MRVAGHLGAVEFVDLPEPESLQVEQEAR